MAGGLTVVPGDGASIEVKGAVGTLTSGSSWWRIPGVSSWTEGGGDTPTRDIVAFEGVSSQSGSARAQTIECEVTAYAPHHRAWRLVRAALVARTTLEFRLRSVRQAILSAAVANVTLAVDASGNVTIGGSDADAFAARLAGSEFSPGMVLEIQGSADNPELLVIEDIDAAPNKTSGKNLIVSAPDAAIAAKSAYRIVIPETVRGPFAASVATGDRATTRAEGDLTAGLTLQAVGILPAFTMVAGESFS